MARFVLNVHDIEASGKSYHFAVPATWVRDVLQGSGLRADMTAADGSLDLRADRSGKDILVTGTLRSRVVTDCVRCLEDAGIDVDVQLAWLFTARGPNLRPEPDESVVTPDELDREFYSGDEIELDEIIREHLILEVPMQPLCAADCPGIEIPEHVRPPADFGQGGRNGGPDPRLTPLQELAARLKKEPEEESRGATARPAGGVAAKRPGTPHDQQE